MRKPVITPSTAVPGDADEYGRIALWAFFGAMFVILAAASAAAAVKAGQWALNRDGCSLHEDEQHHVH